jgi:phenylpropionate dioxygenase-like ring-hydroxylating dioxygenase large terminal subunit
MQSYPTSWYRALNSADLLAGEIKSVHYFGRDLAIFRDEDGHPHVVDAYCPHLGANLAVGGSLEGGGIVCPFHGWKFSGKGECLGIPYTNKIPSQAALRAYPTRELNGVIAMFYDELRREPEWFVPEITDYHDKETWTDHIWKTWKVRTHVQEIFENGPDWSHQKVVHCALNFPTSKSEADGVTFTGTFTGVYDAGEGFSESTVTQTSTYIDYGLGFTHLDMVIDYEGMLVNREIQFCITPIDEEYVDASLSTRTKSLGDAELTQTVHELIAFHTWRSFDEDIPIWENKIYRGLPSRLEHNRGEDPAHLAEGEGDIAKFRNWARQFYTDTSCAV